MIYTVSFPITENCDSFEWSALSRWLESYLGPKSPKLEPVNEETFIRSPGLWTVWIYPGGPGPAMIVYKIKDNPDIVALFKLTWL